MAVRAWSETAIPPVFGKETDKTSRPIPQTRVSAIFLSQDQRMKEFFKVQTPDQLYKKMDRFKPLSFEKVSLEDSLHRVLYEDILSPSNVPEFPRSTVDGFAVRGRGHLWNLGKESCPSSSRGRNPDGAGLRHGAEGWRGHQGCHWRAWCPKAPMRWRWWSTLSQ